MGATPSAAQQQQYVDSNAFVAAAEVMWDSNPFEANPFEANYDFNSADFDAIMADATQAFWVDFPGEVGVM